MYQTLIDAKKLQLHINDTATWRIIDCRFSLDNPQRGLQDYLQNHIPNAIYAHLNNELSSEVILGKTGRHPLPDLKKFKATLEGWGISNSTQVVVYDDAGGAFAARLWWLLRFVGHENVAVLDGGFPLWQQHYSVDALTPTYPKTIFTINNQPQKIVDANAVLALIQSQQKLLLDARGLARFRGEQEPIDPIAGHIPTAHCAPFPDNLNPDNTFKSADELRLHFLNINPKNKDVVCYCGSGVTATHNILAMVHAGFDEPQLYPGSWSEWIMDASRPVATGDNN